MRRLLGWVLGAVLALVLPCVAVADELTLMGVSSGSLQAVDTSLGALIQIDTGLGVAAAHALTSTITGCPGACQLNVGSVDAGWAPIVVGQQVTAVTGNSVPCTIASGAGLTWALTGAGCANVASTNIYLTSSLGVTDAKPVFISAWIFTTNDPTNAATSASVSEIFNQTTSGASEGTNPGSQGLGLVTSDGSPNQSRAQLNFTDSVSGSAAHTIDLTTGTSNVKCPNSSFLQVGGHWYTIAIDPANNEWAVYIDNQDMVLMGGSLGSGCINTTTINNIVTNLNTAHGLWFWNGPVYQAAASWGWIGPSFIDLEAVVCSNTSPITTANGSHACTGAHTIPADIRAKIARCTGTACVPLQLGPTGMVPTGRQPEVFVDGNAATYPNNLGSASTTAFTVHAFNPGGALFDAPYSFAGIPAHQATEKWLQGNTAPTITTSGPSMTTAAGSFPIPASPSNVLLVYVGEVSDSSGSVNQAMTCNSGFTQVTGSNIDGTGATTSELCYKLLVGGDTSGAYTIGWGWSGSCTIAATQLACASPPTGKAVQVGDRITGAGITAGTNVTVVGTAGCVAPSFCTISASFTIATPEVMYSGASRSHGWYMAEYDNVASVDVAACHVNTASTTPSPPTGLTTSSANETVVQFLIDSNAGNKITTAASGYAIRYRVRQSGAPAQIAVADKYAVPSGTSTSTGQNWAVSSSATNTACTLSFVPR